LIHRATNGLKLTSCYYQFYYMRRSYLFVVAISLFSLSPVLSQENLKRDKIAEFEKGLPLGVIFKDSTQTTFDILQRMRHYQVPSVSIVVIDGGQITWAKAYGSREVASESKADVNTLYQTASISKAVNAIAVLRLAQEGKISLQKDIREYLTSWKLPENNFSKSKIITISQLLSHTAGLGTGGFFGYQITDTIPNLNQILDGIRPANSDAVRSINAPGRDYFYSGGGTTLIRKILEDKLKTNYSLVMQTTVLDPLGMKRSTYSQPLQASEVNYGRGYIGDGQVVPGGYHIFPELAPDGLWSNATDIGKVIVEIQKSLKGKSTYLKKIATQKMFANVLPSSNYTLGFVVEKKLGETYFSHRGANYGYRSVFYGSMESGKGIVVLTNSENGEMLINEIVNSVAVVYNWKGFYNPVVKELVKVDDALIEQVIGNYSSGEAKFPITLDNGKLMMTGNAPEQLFYVGNHTFFLLSNPNIQVQFSSSNGSESFDVLELKENGKLLIKAIKS
jgi:CubicO group peptidase (beta-lactamase class C family)